LRVCHRGEEDREMEWDNQTRERLETALNESDVVGVRLDPSEQHVDVLLHVLSLPLNGPLAKDGRRILRLMTPSELRFLLRTDPVGEQPANRPAIPIADLAAVERFFDSLAWGGSIYGWRFFDEPDLTSDWPMKPSLAVQLRDLPADHTFYWFNECGVEQDGTIASYCIEGTIGLDDLLVLDASGNEIPHRDLRLRWCPAVGGVLRTR
jgi:hypothetical protein